MNAIEHWRRRRKLRVDEAAQVLDTTPEAYELIERGIAPSKLHGVRAVEVELGAPYPSLKKELK